MGSHFSAIGFSFDSQEAMAKVLQEIAPDAEAIPVEVGLYLRWRSATGGELWVQAVDGEVVGLQPHYVGPARMPVCVTARVPLPDDSALDGTWYAWADPDNATGDEALGVYPFLFSAPDARLLDGLQPQARRVLQIALFAHDIRVGETREAFHEEDLRLAPIAAVPLGLFVEEGEPPQALVLYAGTVLSVNRLVEPKGDAFYHLHLATLGGEVDVVASEEQLATVPAVGWAVRVSGWVSARVVPED